MDQNWQNKVGGKIEKSGFEKNAFKVWKQEKWQPNWCYTNTLPEIQFKSQLKITVDTSVYYLL